jgi:hypothetical protein
VFHRDPDAPLQLADVVRVRVDAGFVRGPEVALEGGELADDRVEDT